MGRCGAENVRARDGQLALIVRPGDDCHAMRRHLDRLLEERFGIDHVTLQVDHATEVGRLLDIEQEPTR